MSLVRKGCMKSAIEPKLSEFAPLWGMCQRFRVNVFFLVHFKPVIMELYFILHVKRITTFQLLFSFYLSSHYVHILG